MEFVKKLKLKGLFLNMVVVVAIAIASLASSTEARRSTWPIRTWHVDVVNGLSGGKALDVHCKSKDDDLGDQNLGVGAMFEWTFKDNFWGTTLYWCYMSKPDNAHSSFEVFWVEKDKDHWLYNKCDWKRCIWTAKDDGIYLKNIPLNNDELVHKWE